MNCIYRISLFILLCMGFTSCSDSENVLDNKQEETEINKELSPFVGYWISDNRNRYSDLLLFDNGTCMSPSSVDIHVYSEGKWTFDDKTQYLSETATGKTFLLTLHDEKSLIGVDLSTNRTVSYTKKGMNDDALDLIMNGTWLSSDGTSLEIKYTSSLRGDNVPNLPDDTQKIQYKSKRMRCWVEDEDNNTGSYQIVWEVKIWHSSPDNRWYDSNIDSKYKGTIKLENPYSPSKCKLTLTGVLAGTYIKK